MKMTNLKYWTIIMLKGKSPGLKFKNLHYLTLVLTLRKSAEVSGPSFPHLSQEWVRLEKSHKVLDKIDLLSFNLYIWLNQMKMMIFNHFDLQKMEISYGSTHLGWSWPIRHDQSRGSIQLHLTVNLLHFLQQLHSFSLWTRAHPLLYPSGSVISKGNNPFYL